MSLCVEVSGILKLRPPPIRVIRNNCLLDCLIPDSNRPLTDQISPTAANFGSNNPFRNRALSPSNASAASARPERPRSTNPFLDDSETLSPQSAPGLSTGTTMFSPTEKQDLTSNARDLFVRVVDVPWRSEIHVD